METEPTTDRIIYIVQSDLSEFVENIVFVSSELESVKTFLRTQRKRLLSQPSVGSETIYVEKWDMETQASIAYLPYDAENDTLEEPEGNR